MQATAVSERMHRRILSVWPAWVRLALIGWFVFLALHYLWSPISTDHAEPSIIAIAANYAHGHPLYHGPESGERYAIIYGPIVFLLPALFLKAFGFRIWVAKLPFILSALAVPPVIFGVFKRRCGPAMALALTSTLLCTLLMFSLHSYWTRPDPLLVLTVVLSIRAMDFQSPLARGITLGVMAGLATNVKAYAPALFLPVFLSRWDRDSWRVAFIATGAAVATLVAPFLAPGVFWRNYRLWVGMISVHGISADLLLKRAPWAAICLAPFEWARQAKTSRQKLGRRDRIYIAAVLSSFGAIWLCSGKPGSEPHYFMPFLPTGFLILADALALGPPQWAQRYWAPPLGWLSLIGLLIFLAGGLSDGMPTDPTAPRIIADIRHVMADNPGAVVSVGMGEKEGLATRFRTIPVLAGNPLFLDECNLIDAVFDGIPVPPATYRMIRDCEVDIWLIPRGETPFRMPSALVPEQQLLPGSFRRQFEESYRKVGHSEYYDLWECRKR